MFQLDTTEEQLHFETLYRSSKHGRMSNDYRHPTANISPLLDMVIQEIQEAPFTEGGLQMQVASLDYSNFVR